MKHNAITTICLAAATCAGGYFLGRTTNVEAADQRVFELRTYHTNEGKLPDLLARFRNHTTKLFEKHGMTNVGYWVPQDDPAAKNTLIYVLAFPGREAAKKSWDAFRGDPVWQKVQKESEVNGKLVDHVDSVFMTPADFSKIK